MHTSTSHTVLIVLLIMNLARLLPCVLSTICLSSSSSCWPSARSSTMSYTHSAKQVHTKPQRSTKHANSTGHTLTCTVQNVYTAQYTQQSRLLGFRLKILNYLYGIIHVKLQVLPNKCHSSTQHFQSTNLKPCCNACDADAVNMLSPK